MLTIRLSRVGKPKQPSYRLIISEKTKDPYDRNLEILGSYDPFNKELKCKTDRITYWISKGAKMSATVNNLLITKGIITGDKVKASKAGKKAVAAETKTEAKPADKPAVDAAPAAA